MLFYPLPRAVQVDDDLVKERLAGQDLIKRRQMGMWLEMDRWINRFDASNSVGYHR